MKFGAHVSIAGGLWNAPANAAAIGCEVFQIFSRPPQGGKAAPITPEVVKQFRAACDEFKQAEWYIHTPYFINFASATPRIRHGSITIVREELERGSQIGAAYVMAHLGSFKDMGQEAGIQAVKEGLAKMLDGYKGETQFLIEIAAGSGEIIGDTFEEIAEIINAKELRAHDIGVCFDTQHAFASGYDLRTRVALDDTLKQFDATIGLSKLKMSHCNDSKVEFGGKRDRHEHIGDGFIGKDGFKTIITHPKLKNMNLVLETQHDKVVEDLKILKESRE